ncbi:unnamed protein product [Brugia timori]|uniref:Uncharacterized protein n=1 Tax=Brugia timori TaxID=42155 RepID=A0A3P7TNH1_9BILA|nr:unnamed protein product [Brugia timori]
MVEYCGASSAYFLRTLAPLDINIEIHLFNQGTIGGRLTTIQMPYSDQKRIFEAGGSVLHPANLYFKNWMENFGNLILLLDYIRMKKKGCCEHVEWSGICLSGKFMVYGQILSTAKKICF